MHLRLPTILLILAAAAISLRTPARSSETAAPQPFAAALQEYREHTRTTPPPTNRFETGIQAFFAADRTNPPPRGIILFIGSSIFKQWTNVVEQMAPLPVFNRAFGGSRTSDILERMDQIVLPYAPKVIVYYAGGNDINNREPAAAVFGRMYDFEQRVHARYPDTQILFVAVDRAPMRRENWDVVDAANALVRDYCAATPRLTFVDLNPVTHTPSGDARLELYKPDRLHFQPATYAQFTAVIKPVLEKLWGRATTETKAVPQ